MTIPVQEIGPQPRALLLSALSKKGLQIVTARHFAQSASFIRAFPRILKQANTTFTMRIISSFASEVLQASLIGIGPWPRARTAAP